MGAKADEARREFHGADFPPLELDRDPPNRVLDVGETRTSAWRQRYDLREVLGEGATGRVYRAFDRQLGYSVALKTLRSIAAEDSYRLKKEFRALVDLAHPNLVRLFDLVATESQCFFTMELVEGTHFLDWLWRGSVPSTPTPLDSDGIARLRYALPQLVRAIATLHAAGSIHRDIKPSNALVTPNGRLVLVDLGFASRFESFRSVQSQVGQIVGTIDYMAPEQARGDALSPAADWYSLGVLLHHALTGCLPHTGTGLELLLLKRSNPPPPKTTFAAGLPPDLVALTESLLAPLPEHRPDHDEVLRRLSAESGVPFGGSSERRSLFVGRDGELLRLDLAFETARRSRSRTVHVTCDSGMGKSTLVEQFASSWERRSSALVLRSRCHYREQVPFKALDGIMDDLSRSLLARPQPDLFDLLPEDAASLVRMFPVLGRVAAFAESLDRSRAALDQTQRTRAFDALRRLFSRLAIRERLILWVDDLQWADRDSVSLLSLLSRADGAPGFLLVLSYRPAEACEGPAAPLVAERGQAAETIEVGRLTDDEARLLVRHLLVRGKVYPDEATVDQVIEAAAGSPLLAHELSNDLQGSGLRATRAIRFEELLVDKMSRLDAPSRRLLELLAVAGRPVGEQVVFRYLEPSVSAAAISVLRWKSLVRHVRAHDLPALEISHDRIREAVLSFLSDDQQRELHAELGRLLEQIPGLEPRELVDHFLVAGDRERAASYAVAAADDAVKCLAFDRAASLYRRALELGEQPRSSWRIRTNLGRSLASAGYGSQGAIELLQASRDLAEEDPRSLEIVLLRAAAGERFIQAGFLREGIAAMQDALSAIGVRYAETPGGALLRTTLRLPLLLLARWRWRRRQGSSLGHMSVDAPSERDRLRLELSWSAGVAIGTIDTIRGVQFQTLHAMMAYRTGSIEHLARAFSVAAVVDAMKGRAIDWERSQRHQAAAHRYAEQSGDGNLEAFIRIYSGVLAFFHHRFRDILEHIKKAQDLCRTRGVGTVWDIATARWLMLMADAQRGAMSEVAAKLPDFLIEADERKDRYASACYRLGWVNFVWLCNDDPDEAAHQAKIALQPFLETRINTFRIQGLLAEVHIDLYRNEPRRAFHRLEEQWGAIKRSFQLQTAAVHCALFDLRGRAALALARSIDDASRERAKALRLAGQCARALAKNPLPTARGLSLLLKAGIAALSGRPEAAVEALELGAAALEQADMEMHAAAARYQLARLLPAARAAPVRARAELFMDAQRVARPDRIARVLVPGFGEPPMGP